MNELLSVEEMTEADRRAISRGVAGIDLMEAAGKAVFDASLPFVGAGRNVLVACGPGNNGGDGFIVARLLIEAGCQVKVAVYGNLDRNSADARLALDRLGPEHVGDDLSSVQPERFGLVIDALFGAGLERPLSGEVADFVERLNDAAVRVISVDLPSGISGNGGLVLGTAVKASRTVTFFRKKPGHLLYPGRQHCGETIVADIGIDPAVLEDGAIRVHENAPTLWKHVFPCPSEDGHKYDRGHALVVSGARLRTGAARLAAMAGLRSGAGLVTLACERDASDEIANHVTALMVREYEGPAGLGALLADKRLTSIVIGPGGGVGADMRDKVEVCLRSKRVCVLDADALSSFSDDSHRLFSLLGKSEEQSVLTPHAGEFARLFDSMGENKLARTIQAASTSRSIVVFKGADTVIAAPDGRAAINANAPAWLATAGTGDVLAGLIGGLLAQGMPAYEAACAGVWLHGEAAQLLGPGLIAEDLQKQLPAILAPLVTS
ncbi:MAG: NAD(P)H-hydrate dehydratase [Rhizobiaceae bacterium]